MTALSIGLQTDAAIGYVQAFSADSELLGRGVVGVIRCKNDVNRSFRYRLFAIAAIGKNLESRIQGFQDIGFKYNGDPEYCCKSQETVWHEVPFCYRILGERRAGGRVVS